VEEARAELVGIGTEIGEEAFPAAGGLAEDRAPAFVVEESPTVFLPRDVSGAWPKPESWMHAQSLIGLPGAPRVPFAPRDAEDLLAKLREGDPASGRRPLPADRAALVAWDLASAAIAWERDRAAWWMAWRSWRGPGVPREARRRASDWGLRILPPRVTCSDACARAEAVAPGARYSGAVRLGLDDLGPHVTAAAARLVRERHCGGRYTSWWDLARRALRAGVDVRALAALAVAGALADLDLIGSVTAFVRAAWHRRARLGRAGLRRVSPALTLLPGTERRAACGLSCLAP
jgi:hypothetical protein